MPDNFVSHAPSLTGPAGTAFAVTPADGTDLPEVTRSLYVGGPGNISVVMLSGAQVSFLGLAAGTILPVRVQRVRATGTTATSIVGLA